MNANDFATSTARRAVLAIAAGSLLALAACGTVGTAGTATTADTKAPASTVTVTEHQIEPATTPTITTTVTLHADGISTTTAPPVTVTVTEPAPRSSEGTAPAGFHDLGDGVWFAWADKATFDCPEDADGCWGVELWSAEGCAEGVEVHLDIYKPDSDIVLAAMTWQADTALPAGERTVFIPTTDNLADRDVEASVAELSCA